MTWLAKIPPGVFSLFNLVADALRWFCKTQALEALSFASEAQEGGFPVAFWNIHFKREAIGFHGSWNT